MSDSPAPNPAKAWDEVRLAFASSIMVDTSLSSLAQNLDGPDWPITGREETPTAYIDLSYEEMRELLALKGYPEHAELLISILQDTLAFDDPFGDMVQQAEAAGEKDNALLKNLARLDVPEAFPIALTALDADTRDFCRLEGLTTLGEFARFAQGMSQSVIVGGDFRKLLNALSHVDEQTLAAVLPYRPGRKGLHLVECLAQNPPTDAVRADAAIAWFADEFAALQADVAGGTELSRAVMVLHDPAAERRVTDLLRPRLKVAAPAKAEKPRSLFGALSRMFGRKD